MAIQDGQRKEEINSGRRPRHLDSQRLEMESRSMVEICGTNKSKCGYCKADRNTSVSYGLIAKRLTCTDYQELIDRGWRRSGTFIYKPVMHETCCPQYTIRLDVTRFKPTKGQRHVVNRLERYLDSGNNAGYDSNGTNSRQGMAQAAGVIAANDGHNGNGKNKNKKKKRAVSKGDESDAKIEKSGPPCDRRIAALSKTIAIATIAVVEDGMLPGLELEPEWRTEVANWSQVRPNKSKGCRALGGGLCSTVALRVASAARKRGWKGAGDANGAVNVAEAIAKLMNEGRDREREGVSDIAVASNGFINLTIDAEPASIKTLTDPDGPPPSATAAESTSSESHVPPPTLEGTSGSSTNDPPPPPPVASRQDRVTAAARVASGSRYGATLPADSGHAVQEERGRMLRGDGAASVTGEERRESMDVEVENDAHPTAEGNAAPVPVRAGSGSSAGLSSLPLLNATLASHRMTVSTVPARVTDEVFGLYKKYQVNVHGDHPSDVSPGQFCRFLVDSPLIRERDKSRGTTREVTEGHDSLVVPYGSYHQLYRIDGQLVAVGVVDILPKCLSSVYCFYDPDYRALALGKLTALKETEFVRNARELRPDLRDYYMGFYIHTCPKMSYKGSYSPSFLLCPERLSWVPLELCRPVLDVCKYSRLSDVLGSSMPASNGSDARGRLADATGDHGRDSDAGAVSNVCGAKGSSSAEQGSRRPCGSSPVSPARRAAGQGPSRTTRSPHPVDPTSGDGDLGGMYDGERMESVEEGVPVRRSAATRAALTAADEASGMNEIPLLLGRPPFPINLKALTPQSQVILRDVLKPYLTTMGPDLAKRVILKLMN